MVLKSRTAKAGGNKRRQVKESMEEMTASEVLRLWEYLRAKGWTGDEIIALVVAIAGR